VGSQIGSRHGHSRGPRAGQGDNTCLPTAPNHPPMGLQQRPWTAPTHTHRSKIRDTQIGCHALDTQQQGTEHGWAGPRQGRARTTREGHTYGPHPFGGGRGGRECSVPTGVGDVSGGIPQDRAVAGQGSAGSEGTGSESSHPGRGGEGLGLAEEDGPREGRRSLKQGTPQPPGSLEPQEPRASTQGRTLPPARLLLGARPLGYAASKRKMLGWRCPWGSAPFSFPRTEG